MVRYRAKVLRVYIDEGPAGEVVESQLVLDVGGHTVEAFNLSIVPPGEGSTVEVDLSVFSHDVVKVNIPEKFMKQLTRYPMVPWYACVGQVVDIVGTEKRHWIVFDCGIVLEADWPPVRGDPREELRVGDWVYVKGRMDAKIVGEEG